MDYFIQVNTDEVPVVILLNVHFMTHSLIDIFALWTYYWRQITIA